MDKELLKQKIETVFANFKSAIYQHTDINGKRADGGWSVGEIADHIIKGTGAQFGQTKKTERPYDQNADSIKNLFLNFQLKFPAAPILQPEAKEYSASELFIVLEGNKDNLISMIEQEDLTETCIDITLPVWGTLTKYEWLVLIENHIIRHTKQVTDFDTVAA
ncbi:DinB family protein [Ferruginibacter sp.]|nr:DinB family protein [Ferruginibacter sp.]